MIQTIFDFLLSVPWWVHLIVWVVGFSLIVFIGGVVGETSVNYYILGALFPLVLLALPFMAVLFGIIYLFYSLYQWGKSFSDYDDTPDPW